MLRWKVPFQNFPCLNTNRGHVFTINGVNVRRVMFWLLKIHTNDDPVESWQYWHNLKPPSSFNVIISRYRDCCNMFFLFLWQTHIHRKQPSLHSIPYAKIGDISRIVQVLYAMEEKPTVSSNAGLKDAAKGKWYSWDDRVLFKLIIAWWICLETDWSFRWLEQLLEL